MGNMHSVCPDFVSSVPSFPLHCKAAPACMSSTSHPNIAKGENSPSGAMAEVLGQRSLLGFGVVLAWLVLFHLLVNIWLLCVFSSLLVVLGSWLASQAVLESNNVVRLERFITFEQVNVPGTLNFRHS